MSEKILPSHVEREAYVYIRQSSMQQVRTRLDASMICENGRRRLASSVWLSSMKIWAVPELAP